ncbi:MAG: FAD-dependent oxidoreductase [Bryobacterales bacterium]|nr:FAD-dependent oxidoreductase [Bryobacterales bacterium]
MGNSGIYPALIPDVDFWKDMVPCQAACPVHTDAGRYVQLIAIGEYREAYLTARSPNPFASDCGRVCAAPCEDRCRRGKIDAPVSIRALKRFVCEKYGAESREPDTQDELFGGATEPGNKTRWHLPMMTVARNNVARGQKVAVIGAGPAGLACAHDLALMGYPVTVFEASGDPGGMMVHGIPEFRLARAVIDKEIAKITGLGVELRLHAPLNEQFGLQQLRDLGYEAVFLSVGTQRGRGMTVEGQELDGVVKAIDFLLNVNHGYKVALGKRVVVIGGGFVAFDAARMALRTALEGQPATGGVMAAALDAARMAVRAGVSDVRMISLESFAELPVMRTAQGKEEFEQAEREGIRFHPQRGARRFIGRDGRIEAVELVGVSRTYDESGRFSPVYDESISETIEADTIILAIGQQADLSFLRPEDGVEQTRMGTVKVNAETLATSAPGVYAGGDVAFGPRNLIEAIANGKQAALSIDDHLRGVTGGPEIRFAIRKIPTRDYRMAEDYEQHARQAPPTTPMDRRTGFSEVEAGYSEQEARVQAERCLSCHIQTIYDAEKCVLCNRCVDVCPEYCLKLIPLDELNLGGGRRAVLEHYGAAEEGGPLMSAMIKDDEKCIRCGLCAIRCPTDAMTMEVFFYEESEAVGR